MRIEDEVMMIKNWMESRYTISTLVARSAAMRRLVGQASRVAQNSGPVLIVGDEGTGKKLLARAIHNSSAREATPFVCIPAERLTCDTTEHLLEGTVRGEVGAFERAQDGTLLFSGIQNLSAVAQERLARIMSEGEFRTAKGESKPLTMRIMCSAHSGELAEELATGRFSEELYEALSMDVLSMPSLAERTADIPYLVQSTLQAFADRERVKKPSVPYHYMELLTRVEWPENVRQLKNHVESVLALSQGQFDPAILLAHFDEIESPQSLRSLARDLLHKLLPSTQVAAASATN